MHGKLELDINKLRWHLNYTLGAHLAEPCDMVKWDEILLNIKFVKKYFYKKIKIIFDYIIIEVFLKTILR